MDMRFYVGFNFCYYSYSIINHAKVSENDQVGQLAKNAEPKILLNPFLFSNQIQNTL